MRVEDTGVVTVPGQADPGDLEAVLAAEAAQELDVAPPAVAEVEVLADDDQAGGQLVDEHLLDEVPRPTHRPGSGRRNDHRAIDAAVGQQLQLLLEAGQLLGRRLGAHHRSGMAVERDDLGLSALTAAAARAERSSNT